MPYITEEDKKQFQKGVYALKADMWNKADLSVGDLTYLIYKLQLEYVKIKGKRYQHLAEASIAALNSEKEFYRRVTAPYEDLKIKENGDV